MGGLFLYLLGFQIKDVCWYERIIENSNHSEAECLVGVDAEMLIVTEIL